MILANQLRLGNYLYNTCSENKTIAKVSLIDNHRIGSIIHEVKIDLCYSFEYYEPIPLTGKLINDLPGDQLKIGSNGDGFFYYTSNGKFVKLTYLHELQNLYFALSGEELPVNLENVLIGNESSMVAF